MAEPVEAPKEAAPSLYDHTDLNEDATVQFAKPAPPTTFDKPSEKESSPVPHPAQKPEEEPLKVSRPNHPKRLVERAVELGASMSQINATSTEDLDEWVYRTNQDILEEQRFANASSAVQGAGRARQPEPTAPQADEDETLVDELAQEEALSPRIAGLLKKLVQKNKKVEGELQDHGKKFAESENARKTRVLDDAFEMLPDEYKAVFGEGGVSDIDEVSRQWRASALTLAKIDANNPPSERVISKRVREAADRLMGKFKKETNAYAQAQAQAEPPTNGRPTADEWNRSGLPAPTSRETKQQSKGTGQAVSRAREWFANHLPELEDESAELRGMP